MFDETVPGTHSLTLAAWVRAWRAGLVSLDEVLDEVQGDVEHLVCEPDGTQATLAATLPTWSRTAPDAVRVVLPAAGDPRGLPGPGPFSAAALVAGQGVVLGTSGLVPEPTNPGDPAGRWRGVRWSLLPLPDPARPGEPLTVAEADHDLTLALAETTGVLRDLDVARMPPGVARGLTALRNGDGAGPSLPPGYGARARRLAARAGTVAGMLALAATDVAGAAVNGHEMVARDAALRPLATAVRRAGAAAVNGPLEI